MLYHCFEGLFTVIILFSSPDEYTADLRLPSEDSDDSSLSLTASTTALATMMATNSLIASQYIIRLLGSDKSWSF